MAAEFEGQVAIVTGAGRGLGRAYAMELARLGARVVVNDVGVSLAGEHQDTAPAQSVCDEITALGGQAVPSFSSVASLAGGEAIVQAALSAWGRVDGVVCNAGIMRSRAFQNMTEDEWNSVVQVHLGGAYAVLRAAWPVFRQQEYGRAVVISSSVGLYGAFGGANYGAAKAGMLGLMNVLNIEGARYNIKVNAVAPVAATRMSAHVRGVQELSSEDMELGGPEHVAPMVAYLLSRECPEAGLCVEVSSRHVNAARIVASPGIDRDPQAGPPDLAWIRQNWSQIVGAPD
ncbi:MAG: SDR family NAD(P)-dependent oxidoreductase [Dehalococcoidia bacterium]